MPEEARKEIAAGSDDAASTGGFSLIPYLLQRIDHLEMHLRQEMHQREASLRQAIQEGNAALRQEISALRQEVQQGDTSLRQEIAALRPWMIGTLITVIITFVTVLLRGF